MLKGSQITLQRYIYIMNETNFILFKLVVKTNKIRFNRIILILLNYKNICVRK